jgi:hypothetical protein
MKGRGGGRVLTRMSTRRIAAFLPSAYMTVKAPVFKV